MKLRQKENKKTSRRIDETFLCELHPTHKCRTGRTKGRERRLRRAFNKTLASSYCKAIYCAFSGKRSSNQCVKTYSTNISLIIRAMRSAVPGTVAQGSYKVMQQCPCSLKVQPSPVRNPANTSHTLSPASCKRSPTQISSSAVRSNRS